MGSIELETSRHFNVYTLLWWIPSLRYNQVHSLFRASESGTNKVILCCMIGIGVEIIDHIYEYVYYLQLFKKRTNSTISLVALFRDALQEDYSQVEPQIK